MSPRLRLFWQTAAAAAAGALQTLAFVNTAAWWLPIATLMPLVAWLNTARPGRAAWLAWAYGTGWMGAGVWWLFISMHRYGGLPAPVAAAAVLLLAGVLALFLAVAAAAYARWRRGTAWDALLLAALWLLAELARGQWFTGFPWVALGYSQVDSPLAGLAPWVGVYGMGAVAAGVAAALALLARGHAHGTRAWPNAVLAAGAMLVLPLALPADFTRPTGEMSVALLQSNVSQDEKFAAEHMPQTLAWVGRELVAARADLVLSPETAVPLLPGQLEDFAPGYWASLKTYFSAPGKAALVGIPLGDFDKGYTNSVVGLSAGASYRYDKWHLVPFGEFIPRGFRWFTDLMNIPLGDFARGVPNPPSFAVAGQRVGPNICYEDLFGEELALRFVDDALAPTVLANISNMGWFGDSSAITQHLNISRLRALELQRPLIRATNTGATAVVDHRGRVQALLAPHTRGVLLGRVQGREGLTPFARWAAHLGLWPLWAVGVAGVVWGATRRRAQRPSGG